MVDRVAVGVGDLHLEVVDQGLVGGDPKTQVPPCERRGLRELHRPSHCRCGRGRCRVGQHGGESEDDHHTQGLGAARAHEDAPARPEAGGAHVALAVGHHPGQQEPAVVSGHDQHQREHGQLDEQQLPVGGLEQGGHRPDQRQGQHGPGHQKAQHRHRGQARHAPHRGHGGSQDGVGHGSRRRGGLTLRRQDRLCARQHGHAPAARGALGRSGWPSGVSAVAVPASFALVVGGPQARPQHDDETDQAPQPERGEEEVHRVGGDGGPGRRGRLGVAEQHEGAGRPEGGVEGQALGGGAPAAPAPTRGNRPGRPAGRRSAAPSPPERAARARVVDQGDAAPPFTRAICASTVTAIPTTPTPAAISVNRASRDRSRSSSTTKARKKARPHARRARRGRSGTGPACRGHRPPVRCGGPGARSDRPRPAPTRNTTPPDTMCPSVEVTV